jgi:iron complex outermembrane recepter protein
MTRSKYPNWAVVLLGSLGVLELMPAALAADVSATPEIEEIVVTAQKRSENLESVPVAVTAFSAATRDLIGIESTQDMSDYTPGVTYSFVSDRMYVRGLGRSTNNLSIDNSIATYLDGFYSSFFRVADSTSLFLAQEEIYRGPQGTLFGRNAIGGAFVLTSPQPTDMWEGEADLRVGNYQTEDLEATVAGPISDSLRFRFSAGEYKQGQGYFESVNGNQNDGAGWKNNQQFQLQLAGNFGDAYDWWLKADHLHWNIGWGTQVQTSEYATHCVSPNALGAAVPIDTINCGGLQPNPWFNSGTVLGFPLSATPQLTQPNPPNNGSTYSTPNDSLNRERLKDDETFVYQGVGHLGGADLKYIAGYYSSEYDLVTDYDNTARPSYDIILPGAAAPLTINSAEYLSYKEIRHYYSNELDLISTYDGPLQYVLGLYQYDEHVQQPIGIGNNVPQSYFQSPIVAADVFGGAVVPAAPNPSGDWYSVGQKTTSQSEAAFGQIDWKFVDNWKATVGLRYTKDRKDSVEYARYVLWDPVLDAALGLPQVGLDISSLVFPANGAVPDASGNGNYVRSLAIDSHAWTGTAGVEWTPGSDTLGYAKYSRGYKEAGINSGDAIVADPYTKPEYIDAFEVGWKQTFNHVFQINSALFYYKYDGAQYPLTTFGGPVPETPFFNVDEKIYGAEFETQWQATSALRFLIDYSYLHAAFTQHTVYTDAYTGLPASLYGNQVPGSPTNKATFNAVYTWMFTPGSFALSATQAWRDRVTSSPFGDPEFVAGSYGQTDFRGTWNDITNRWSVFGYLRNAFDVRGSDGTGIDTSLYNAAQGYGGPTLARSLIYPRTFGVEFRVRFGAKVHP